MRKLLGKVLLAAKDYIVNEILDDWYLYEAHGAFYQTNHSRHVGIEQHFCAFKIMYSPSRDKYKLVAEGYNPKEHCKYLEVLRKTAKLNEGFNVDDVLRRVEHEVDAVVIVKYLISNDAEDIFSKCCKEDSALIEAIDSVKKEFEENGVEVFEQQKNVVATEQGYFVALWESDWANQNPQ